LSQYGLMTGCVIEDLGGRVRARPAGLVMGVYAAVILLSVGPSFGEKLTVSERRNHVDFSKVDREHDEGNRAKEPSATAPGPRVSWIRRAWLRGNEPAGEAAREPAETVRTQEMLLIESGKTRFVFRQETEFSKGETTSSLKVMWGPDDSEMLSARYEVKKASGLEAWLKAVTGGEAEEGWVEATIGGRVFYYPEKDWISGSIHPEDISLLHEGVDDRLREALESLDHLTRAGYVPYHPCLTDLLVFPVVHEGGDLSPSEYVNQGAMSYEIPFHTSPPDCSFDATFGEVCPETMTAPERAQVPGTELAEGGAQ
jgi:hypothetical protein